MLEGSSLLGKAVVAFESVTEYAAVIAAEFVATQIAKMNEHLLFNGQQPNIS